MACSKQIGIIDIPIVCINLDGYYDSFYSMLQRAHQDQFLYKHPEEILHFEPNSEKAIEWVEKVIHEKQYLKKMQHQEEDEAMVGGNRGEEKKEEDVGNKIYIRQDSLLKRMMSVFNGPIPVLGEKENNYNDDINAKKNSVDLIALTYFAVFTAGLTIGMMSSSKR